MRRALSLYGAGFSLPLILVVWLLLAERDSAGWSGNDPINKVFVIPLFLLSGALLLLIGLATRKLLSGDSAEPPSAPSTLASAVIAGSSLFVLPSMTARLISGWEPYVLAALAIASVVVLWAGSADRSYPQGPARD